MATLANIKLEDRRRHLKEMAKEYFFIDTVNTVRNLKYATFNHVEDDLAPKKEN